jgi:MFS family permease
LRAEIAEGLRFVWHEPRIRSVAGSTATFNLFATMWLAVILVFLRRAVGLSAGHIGVLLALGNIGGLAGAVLAARLAGRFGVGRTILGSALVSGIGELAYPFVTAGDVDVVVIAGGVLTSAGVVVYNVNQLSLRQALCPLALQGRMNASVRFLVWGTMPLGGFLGGLLGGTIGLRPTLWVAGGGAATAFAWIAFSPLRTLRSMPETVTGGPGTSPLN